MGNGAAYGGAVPEGAAGVNTWRRWWVFNGVGLAGFGVQLGVLAALNRLVPGHYLLATAAAIELTLLFNFALHLRFTWGDRGGSGWGQMWRFHLANGVVSMVGNLMLMRVLVGAGVPVLAANAVAVGCCSVVNFVLADVWAFGGVVGV